jgi:hypothetical protein
MMSDAVLIGIVIAVAVLAIAVLAGYFIARRMRGSIRMTLRGDGFSPGDRIEGNFTLETRKEIESKRLFAALIGREVRERRDGDRTRTDTHEFYRDEVTLEEDKIYQPGQTAEYSFAIDAPSGSDGAGSMLGQALDVGLEMLGGDHTEIRWTVEVRLDAKGIDLSDSRSVTVNV